MERSKKKDEKQTLYEIYRACRLCGAGGGYKMPIIQNFVQIDGEEIDLKHKIRECLQLEINSEDRMPPLICELCVDKVTDFYDFLNICRQTNVQTRMRLGLPLKNTTTDSATDTCMLGLMEASSLKLKTEEPPPKKAKKSKLCKELELLLQEAPIEKSLKSMKIEKERRLRDSLMKDKGKIEKESRMKNPLIKDKEKIEKESGIKDSPIKYKEKIVKESRIKDTLIKDKGKIERESKTKDKLIKNKGNINPKTITRINSLEDLVMTKIQDYPKMIANKPGPKSMKKELKQLLGDIENDSNLKLKRLRNKELKETPPPIKKPKPSSPPETKLTQPKLQKVNKSKSTSKTPTASITVQPTQKLDKLKCPACSAVHKNSTSFANHMSNLHPITVTPDNLACNACREWFQTVEESIAHHKKHNCYKCFKCTRRFKTGVLYQQHIENKKCVPETEVPDVKCIACWRLFPTKNLLKEHRCLGPDGRPGGKCSRCNRNYTLLKNLKKHESMCTFRRNSEITIDPEVNRRLLPMQVLIKKCDDLLQYGPVVSACTVPHRHGLDPLRKYPYMPKLRVLKQPRVAMPEERDDQPTHSKWGEFLTTHKQNTLKTLSTLCLKVIYSDKMLGAKLVLNEEEYQKRLSLKRKIDTIIHKFEDSNSCDSNSILDKNAGLINFDTLFSVNRKLGENEVYDSDSTAYDEVSFIGKSNNDASSNIVGDDGKLDDFTVDNDDMTDKNVNLLYVKGDGVANKHDVVSKNDDLGFKGDDYNNKSDMYTQNDDRTPSDETDQGHQHSGSKNDHLSSKENATCVNSHSVTQNDNGSSEVDDLASINDSLRCSDDRTARDDAAYKNDHDNNDTNSQIGESESRDDDSDLKCGDPNPIASNISINNVKNIIEHSTDNLTSKLNFIEETTNHDQKTETDLKLDEKTDLETDAKCTKMQSNVNQLNETKSTENLVNKTDVSLGIKNIDHNTILDMEIDLKEASKEDVNKTDKRVVNIDTNMNTEPKLTVNNVTDTEEFLENPKLNVTNSETIENPSNFNISNNIENKTNAIEENSNITNTNNENIDKNQQINKEDTSNNILNVSKDTAKENDCTMNNHAMSKNNDIASKNDVSLTKEDGNVNFDDANSPSDPLPSINDDTVSNSHLNHDENIEINNSTQDVMYINNVKDSQIAMNNILNTNNNKTSNNINISEDYDESNLEKELNDSIKDNNIIKDISKPSHTNNETDDLNEIQNLNNTKGDHNHRQTIIDAELSKLAIVNSEDYDRPNEDTDHKQTGTITSATDDSNSTKNSNDNVITNDEDLRNDDVDKKSNNRIDDSDNDDVDPRNDDDEEKYDDKIDNFDKNEDDPRNDDAKDNMTSNDNDVDYKNSKNKNDLSDDSLSLKSMKLLENTIDIANADKYNVNDLSDDEKRLMAELDEQIGESDDGNEASAENYNFDV